MRRIKQQLARISRLGDAPLLLALLLAMTLWWLLDNIVVALCVAILLALLLAMARSLWLLHTKPQCPPTESTPMSTHAWTQLPSTPIPTGLPQPDAAALAHSHAVQTYLRQRIHEHGGFLPFEQWMQHALYAPGLGYYAASSTQFGAHGGDFTTAPELTPLFGRSLATQVAQVLRESGSHHILEFGAGSGALAASLIPALRDLGIEPHYHILEISAALRARQQRRLATLDARIQWLDALPSGFTGCMLANEVLDAIPASLLAWDAQGQCMELGVVDVHTAAHASPDAQTRGFALAQRPARDALRTCVHTRMPALPGYRAECNPQAEAWIRQLGACLQTGAIVLIDYGFPQREYYHPQRAEGTLMCHLRHFAHSDPLLYPGLQDITTHVNFTAMANAALESGLEILGYATQARFLINCGILDHVDAAPSQATQTVRAKLANAVQTLLSEAEMGELFKVLALGRGIRAPLLGFAQGDISHQL